MKDLKKMTLDEREALARRDDLPPSIVAALAADPDWYIRVAISERGDLPDDIFVDLAHPKRRVRRTK